MMTDNIFKEGEYEVVWAKAAKVDLMRHVRYMSEYLYVPRTALKIKDEIIYVANKLSYMPQRFPLVLDDHKKPIGAYRRYRVKNYEILFLVDENEPKSVQIIRIFHSKQNWRSNLRSLTP